MLRAAVLAGAALAAALAVPAAAAPAGAAADDAALPPTARANRFHDPFVRVTAGIADCPVPPGPMVTEAEMHVEAHVRAERGTRCYLEGRCRLPNAYAYDQELIARVQKAIVTDGRFGQTSVWVEGQRRWVTLEGCVRSRADAARLVALVHRIDDVEAVIDHLAVTPPPGVRR
ncbi:MAG: BON domain-containing protein [Proteobacteria bacterium]|nr:BON domain-containing protein [Pseudomonadota bacterium]